MRCEDVRAVLPEYAAGETPGPGGLEVHLAGCRECSQELARHRELAGALAALASRVVEPAPALRARLVASIPPRRYGQGVRRLVREHPQAVSVGTAALGAAAIGVLWWRTSRRSAIRAEPSAAVPAEV